MLPNQPITPNRVPPPQPKVIMLQEEPRGPSTTIEIDVTANGQQRIPLPDVAQLRSTQDQKIIVKWVRLITDEMLVRSFLSGNVTAPATELQKMGLTIYAEGWEKGQTIPVFTFNDLHFATGANPFRMNPTNMDNWVNVDFPKSYLQLANGTVTAGAPYCVMFDIGYIKLDASGREIHGPSK